VKRILTKCVIEHVFENVKGRLFPALGLYDEAVIEVNFGNDLSANPFMWQGDAPSNVAVINGVE
jgi:hypothetical protein